jgi:IPT/TIG domain
MGERPRRPRRRGGMKMGGNTRVRYISSIIVCVFIVMGTCGFALAAPSSSSPVAQASTAPTLTSINPNTGRYGMSVCLVGTGFGSEQGTSYVSFDPVKSPGYGSWSETQIWCDVPNITGVLIGPVCGGGALSPILGFGLVMGLITLAGTVRSRQRRLTNK